MIAFCKLVCCMLTYNFLPNITTTEAFLVKQYNRPHTKTDWEPTSHASIYMPGSEQTVPTIKCTSGL